MELNCVNIHMSNQKHHYAVCSKQTNKDKYTSVISQKCVQYVSECKRILRQISDFRPFC